jgi:hypothetical protein
MRPFPDRSTTAGTVKQQYTELLPYAGVVDDLGTPRIAPNRRAYDLRSELPKHGSEFGGQNSGPIDITRVGKVERPDEEPRCLVPLSTRAPGTIPGVK